MIVENTSGVLYTAKKKGLYIVEKVPDLGLLENLGIRVGEKIILQNRYPLGGPVLLKVAGSHSIAVGKDIACKILVKEFMEEAVAA